MSTYSFGKLFSLARNPICTSVTSLRNSVTSLMLTLEDEHFQNKDVALQNFGAARCLRSHFIQHLHLPDEGPEATRKGHPIGISYCDINRDTCNMVVFMHLSVLGISVREKTRKDYYLSDLAGSWSSVVWLPT